MSSAPKAAYARAEVEHLLGLVWRRNRWKANSPDEAVRAEAAAVEEALEQLAQLFGVSPVLARKEKAPDTEVSATYLTLSSASALRLHDFAEGFLHFARTGDFFKLYHGLQLAMAELGALHEATVEEVSRYPWKASADAVDVLTYFLRHPPTKAMRNAVRPLLQKVLDDLDKG